MKKLIRKYRNRDLYQLNCTEAILYSVNEHYNLDLTSDALKMASGFGGGVYEKHLCGIISGAVCALGIFFKGMSLGDQNLLEITVNEFKSDFRQEFDKIECDYLKDNHATEETGCNDIIYRSAELLQAIIDKYN